MEARNITIVSTQNQHKYVVNTDATTLRELKIALNMQHIDYSGMTFYEGLSHTELLTDDAVLPHDVPYRGTTTNELVFMLTNPNKKIRSGANLDNTRAALYDTIEELGLKNLCIEVYGKNFTQCKNSELMSLIEDAQTKHNCECNCDFDVAEAFKRLIEVLVEGEFITDTDVDHIFGTSDVKSAPSPYSDDEINKMFNFIN